MRCTYWYRGQQCDAEHVEGSTRCAIHDGGKRFELTKHERYNRSGKGRARQAAYRATEKGRRNERIQQGARRVRERTASIEQARSGFVCPL